ncbi:Aminoglycoside phosphotransferase [Niveomyces insectorum RCEF 264]|uniref:Aminoglycoside phosphotransferase n=1 Tax=Niveomyces insectorum RCEF 264 TaxID=1081102 RepID=A0A167TWT1_9HYPO|nr:Aminoglycoside phosphotransferase [Niveomyces insectorum RCEF 264]
MSNATMQAAMAYLSKMQINAFFETTWQTQDACNSLAARIVGAPVVASAIQGATSYTVVPTGNRAGLVVQFRTAENALDVDFLSFVEQAYGSRFVPEHRYYGDVGDLKVFTMTSIRGVSLYLARQELRADGGALLRTTVRDFAQFCAMAWHNTPTAMLSPDRAELRENYRSQLQQLRGGLPTPFCDVLGRLLAGLPSLFAPDWPLVPNHTDLLENNIHVDPDTGHLMGICDWKDAEVSPFGISIEGLESLLGHRSSRAWNWVSNHVHLRRHFWDAFAEAWGGLSQRPMCVASRPQGWLVSSSGTASNGTNRPERPFPLERGAPGSRISGQSS